MDRINWRKSEVIAFLEDLLKENTASDKQEEMYIEYRNTGKIEKTKYLSTYKHTVAQMKREFDR
jgi:hypothetical protein